MEVVSLLLILRLFPLLNCTSKKLQSQAVNSKKKGNFFHFNKIKIFECWVIVNNSSFPKKATVGKGKMAIAIGNA
jgi:hypothetical protein